MCISTDNYDVDTDGYSADNRLDHAEISDAPYTLAAWRDAVFVLRSIYISHYLCKNLPKKDGNSTYCGCRNSRI